MSYLTKALKVGTPSAAFYHLRSKCWRRLGDTKAEQEDARRAAVAPVQFAVDHFFRGRDAAWNQRGNVGLEEAVKCFRAALRVEPAHFPSLVLMALYLDGLKRHEEAISACTACIALRSDHKSAYLRRGQAHIELQQYDEAVSDLTRYIELEPQLSEGFAIRGWAYEELGQRDKALSDLEKAIELGNHKRPSNLHFYRGNNLAELNKLDDAIAVYQEAIRLKPDWAANNNLGDVLARKRLLEEAIAAFKQAIRVRPEEAMPHYNLGLMLARKGLLSEATASYQEAIRCKPDYLDAHNELGNIYLAQGHLPEAIAAYRKVIEIKPDNAGGHRNLGLALQRHGKLDEAIAAYRKAIEINPSYCVARINLIGVLLDGRDSQGAIAVYEQAVPPEGDSAHIHNHLGIALSEKGRLDESIGAFKEAVRLKPQDASGHSNLAEALRRKGLLDDAIAAGEVAVRLNPGFADAHKNLGDTLRDKGLLDAAMTAYKEALRLQPENAEYHWHLGDVLCKKQLLEEAVSAYKEAIRLKPDYAGAPTNLAEALRRKGLPDVVVARLKEAIRSRSGNADRREPNISESKSIAEERRAPRSQSPMSNKKRIEWLFDSLRAHQDGREARAYHLFADVCYRLEEHPSAEEVHLIDVMLGAVAEKLGAHAKQRLAVYRCLFRHKHDEAARASDVLVTAFPQFGEDHWLRGWVYYRLEANLRTQGRSGAARTAMRNAIDSFRKATEQLPDEYRPFASLAWVLATAASEDLRAAQEALQLAKRSMLLNPKSGSAENAVQAACYRLGHWQAALPLLNERQARESDGSIYRPVSFFWAMAYWQLGERKMATIIYERTIKSLEATHAHDDEFQRFRAEAETLMGIKRQNESVTFRGPRPPEPDDG